MCVCAFLALHVLKQICRPISTKMMTKIMTIIMLSIIVIATKSLMMVTMLTI